MSNKQQLSFNDDQEEVPVEQETKELICIGNPSATNLKVQFSVKEGCYKYQIRTDPQVITIKKGYISALGIIHSNISRKCRRSRSFFCFQIATFGLNLLVF